MKFLKTLPLISNYNRKSDILDAVASLSVITLSVNYNYLYYFIYNIDMRTSS